MVILLTSLGVVMVAIGVSSLEAAFRPPGEFLGVLLGVLCCLEYKLYVERCFEVAPYDVFNTNLEQSIVRNSLGLGIGLVAATSLYGSQETVIHSAPSYQFFLLIQMAQQLILLLYLVYNRETFIKEATGYFLLGSSAVLLAAELVLSWFKAAIQP